jgi:hypothetical protein
MNHAETPNELIADHCAAKTPDRFELPAATRNSQYLEFLDGYCVNELLARSKSRRCR